MKKQLTLTDISANLTKDFDTFGKMDPFLRFTVGKEIYKTQTAQSQGKTPKWMETFTIPFLEQSQMQVKAFDEDVTQNQYMGAGKTNINEFKPFGERQIQLYDQQGISVGTVKFKYQMFNPIAIKEQTVKNLQQQKKKEQKQVILITNKKGNIQQKLYNKSRIMKKGFLKINITSIQSEYYANKDYFLKVKNDKASFNIPSKDLKFYATQQNIYFPITDHLEIIISENRQTDTRQGYFNIPLTKIYQFPNKTHLINVNCVWREKSDLKVIEGKSATLKLSIVFMENASAKFEATIVEADLIQVQESDKGLNKKLDVYVDFRVQDVSHKTAIKQQPGKKASWNEVLTFVLQNIPGKLLICLKDKDMVNDDVIGLVQLNPLKEKMFVQTTNPIDRSYNLNDKNIKTASLKIRTFFKINQSKHEEQK